jgi:hypothetical protein
MQATWRRAIRSSLRQVLGGEDHLQHVAEKQTCGQICRVVLRTKGNGRRGGIAVSSSPRAGSTASVSSIFGDRLTFGASASTSSFSTPLHSLEYRLLRRPWASCMINGETKREAIAVAELLVNQRSCEVA